MLLRKTTPAPTFEPPSPAPALPQTEDGVDAALLALEDERSAIQAALADLPARETALLDANADDSAFVALDVEKKRHERALERLDRWEQQLVGLAERYQAQSQQRGYTDLRQLYIGASRALAQGAQHVESLLAEVNALSSECDRAGFSLPQMPTLPRVGYAPGQSIAFDGHLIALRHQAAIAEQTPAQVPRLAPRERTFAVRFRQWTPFGQTAYQNGQIAFFSASICDRLVASGRAERMEKGMAFDPVIAAWGKGAVTVEARPAPVQQHERDE